MKTTISILITIATLICSAGYVAVIAEEPPKPATATKRHVVYQIPTTCIHNCTDQEEARRRWKATGELTSADVFHFSGHPTSKRLDPILRMSAIREFGGGTVAEPMQFGVDVTDNEDKAIRDALAKGELFIIYYHLGW